MKIFIWVQQGRLGNLIFQYQMIRNIIQVKDVIFSLDNELFKLLQVDSAIVRMPIALISGNHFASKLFIYFWNFFFVTLSRLRLVSRIEAKEVVINGYASETRELVNVVGLFSFLVVVRGFFQNDENFSCPISLRGEIKKIASERLERLTGPQIRVGVHLRATDYEKWSIMGKRGLVLPKDWYLAAVESIEVRAPDACYIVFTDSPSIAKSFFGSRRFSIYRGDSHLEDFAAMTLCDHLIISPSSFSLAAALTSYQPGKIIIAPKYWLGFKSREWFPVDIYSNKLEYLDVDPFDGLG